MKLYRFDGVDETLALLPLAARRALDLAGLRLSREGFVSLSLAERKALVEAGEAERVDTSLVSQLAGAAVPGAECQPRLEDPSAEEVPPEVTAALGPERPLPSKVWQVATSLDRYALFKVCRKGRPERIAGAYAELVGESSLSTHLRPEGGVRMVDVSRKDETHRVALAESWVAMGQTAFERLVTRAGPKGDVLGTARLAGIMATKKTSELIPLCHPLMLARVEVDFEERAEARRLRVLCRVEVKGPTGVEMEALVGASVAALTVYDMLKSLDRGMSLGPTRLLEKTGGHSGDFRAEEVP